MSFLLAKSPDVNWGGPSAMPLPNFLNPRRNDSAKLQLLNFCGEKEQSGPRRVAKVLTLRKTAYNTSNLHRAPVLLLLKHSVHFLLSCSFTGNTSAWDHMSREQAQHVWSVFSRSKLQFAGQLSRLSWGLFCHHPHLPKKDLIWFCQCTSWALLMRSTLIIFAMVYPGWNFFWERLSSALNQAQMWQLDGRWLIAVVLL